MDTDFHVEACEPVYQISCYSCSIIAGQDTDEELLRETAKNLGFVALHSEEDGSYNLCRHCVESDPELFTPKPIDMIIHCPSCGKQHIDRPDPEIAELAVLQEEFHLSSLGDRPQSLAAEKLRRLTELETLAPTFWSNPVHKSHTCRTEDGGCGTIFRVADVPTNGVEKISTRGEKDTWPISSTSGE